MALFFTYIKKEPETQEQVQARVDSMNAYQFNAVMVGQMYAVVSDQFNPFYASPCGLPTENGMMVLACARRLARENNIDVGWIEVEYASVCNQRVVIAEESMLLEQD